MFSTAAALLALPLLVLAVPTPNTPGPNDKYTQGGDCTIAWLADDTGSWSNMNIEFMTGPNSPMIHLRTIGTVNAATTTNFTWTCPEVTVNSAIYFYQFSSQEDPAATTWSTRFLIAGADGSSTPPTNVTTTGIPYGVGEFVDPSLYNAQPSYMVGNGQLVGGPSDGSNTTPTSPTGTSSTTSDTSTPVNLPAATSSIPTSLSNGKVTTSVTSSPSSTAPPKTSSSGAEGQSGGAASLTLSNGSSLFVMVAAALFGAALVSV